MTHSIYKSSLLLSILTVLYAGSSSANTLLGSRVLVTNQFKGDSTNGIEVDVTEFGLTNNLFATVGDDVELPGFITLYDIDLTADSVRFNWIESEFSNSVSGKMPSDKHDRNYFVFDLPDNIQIASVEFDVNGSQLHEGSALPTVKLISTNKFMTEFSSGVIRKPGFKPSFKIAFNAE